MVAGAHALGISALAGLTDSRLASGSADSMVKLWRVPSPESNGKLQELATLAGHSGPGATRLPFRTRTCKQQARKGNTTDTRTEQEHDAARQHRTANCNSNIPSYRHTCAACVSHTHVLRVCHTHTCAACVSHTHAAHGDTQKSVPRTSRHRDTQKPGCTENREKAETQHRNTKREPDSTSTNKTTQG